MGFEGHAQCGDYTHRYDIFWQWDFYDFHQIHGIRLVFLVCCFWFDAPNWGIFSEQRECKKKQIGCDFIFYLQHLFDVDSLEGNPKFSFAGSIPSRHFFGKFFFWRENSLVERSAKLPIAWEFNLFTLFLFHCYLNHKRLDFGFEWMFFQDHGDVGIGIFPKLYLIGMIGLIPTRIQFHLFMNFMKCESHSFEVLIMK